MAELEFKPIDFITVGTIGPKGKRQFNLQGGHGQQLITLTVEKEQARRLAQAITDLLDELTRRNLNIDEPDANIGRMDMDLRDPVNPEFRVAQMGLGYDEAEDKIVLVVEELVIPTEEQDPDELEPSIVRFWGTREQYRALAMHALKIVDMGRPDPKQNGYTIYYWA